MRRNKSFWLRTRDSAIVLAVLPLLPFLIALGILIVPLYLLYKGTLYLLIWTLWLPRGKDILFVYSDSPTWHDYLVREVLPRFAERAIVLNYSERRTWSRWSFPVRVFRSFGGDRSFCPLIILFRPLARPKLFRFWGPFKDWKHGHRESVEQLTEDVFALL